MFKIVTRNIRDVLKTYDAFFIALKVSVSDKFFDGYCRVVRTAFAPRIRGKRTVKKTFKNGGLC